MPTDEERIAAICKERMAPIQGRLEQAHEEIASLRQRLLEQSGLPELEQMAKELERTQRQLEAARERADHYYREHRRVQRHYRKAEQTLDGILDGTIDPFDLLKSSGELANA